MDSTASSAPPTNASVNSLSIAAPVGFMIFMIVIVLFQFKDSIPNFTIVLWVSLCIGSYVIAVVVHFITQQITCRKIDSGKAFQGGLATLGAMVVGLGISSVAWFRIPVVSVFAPLLLESPAEVTVSPSSTSCCTSTRTLAEVEEQSPVLRGLAYGFYLFFASLFGMVIGTSLSVTC